MQSRACSWLEVILNVGSGYLLALLTQQLIFPLFNISVTLGETAEIAAVFTAISVVRGYLWRRLFNYFVVKKYRR